MALLIPMKYDAYFYSPEKCFGLCNTTGYHPGPGTPPSADGAPFELQNTV